MSIHEHRPLQGENKIVTAWSSSSIENLQRQTLCYNLLETKSSRCRAFYDHALQDIRIACRESSRTIFKAACSSSRKCPRRGCPNAHIGARAQRPRRERCSHPQTGRTARLQEEWWDWKEAPKALGIPM
eukprot:1191670-Prorocentrum_minimum.AAC.3